MARPRKRRPAAPPSDEGFNEEAFAGQANALFDRVDSIFDRLAGGVDRLAGWWNQAQEVKQRVQQRRPAPPPPGPGAPPPPRQPPPPQRDNKAEAFQQALLIFGWKNVPFTKKQVKDRRTQLLANYHPDPQGGLGDDTMFKRVSAAASILSKRATDA